MRFARILLAMVCLAIAPSAFAQSSIINSGAVTPGHAPMYVQGGIGSQVVATDSGPAGGGNVGLGLSELLLTARGTGTPPYVAQGSGPLGTNVCDYDAPITNATGYHYLCWGPNPGQLVFGFGGAASANPFSFIINGATYTFPASGVGGNIATYTSPTTANAFPCWSNTVGLLADCSVSAATLVGNPSASSAKAGAFTIQSLPQRASIDANNDKVLLYNNSTGAFNYVTPAQIAVSQTAGVASLGGVTGDITLGTGLQMDGQQLQSLTGGSTGQILWNNSGAQAGFTATGDVSITPSTGATTIQPGVVNSSKIAVGGVANSNIAAGAANTMKGSLNGTTTSDITLVACSAAYQFTQWVTGTGWQCGVSPVLPSRAVAATMNLAAFSAVTTQGYAQPGDGGGATFKNVGSAAFIDSFVPTGTGGGAISSAGSGCPNGTYYGVSPTGGNGHGLQGIAVISGNVMTSFQVTGTGGNAYHAADVITIPSATVTCTTQPTWTVSSLTTPTGSFSDTASDHWQIVVDQGNFPNTRQFGAKLNYNPATGDGAATDDQPFTQNAINFASWGVGSPDAGGFIGNTVIVPQGASKICNGLMVPTNVVLTGVEESGTELKECDSDSSSTEFITLGDPNNHQSSFNNGIHNMTLFGTSSAACGSCAMVYSNSTQYGDSVEQVAIYPISRGCIFYEIGWGGTSDFEVHRMYCVPNTALTPFGVSIGGTFGFSLYNSQFSAGGSPWAGAAIIINGGGYNDIVSVHCENMQICLQSNVLSAGPITHVAGMVGNAALSFMIDIEPGSLTGTVVGENLVANASGCTVFVSGACTVTGNSTARGIY